MVLTAASSSRRASIWVLQKLDIRCEWEMSGVFLVLFCLLCVFVVVGNGESVKSHCNRQPIELGAFLLHVWAFHNALIGWRATHSVLLTCQIKVFLCSCPYFWDYLMCYESLLKYL
jgi:hypothetical protein